LTLSGERKFDGAANVASIIGGNVSRANLLGRSLYRNPSTAVNKASYPDGILEIHMPKAEESKPQQISIGCKGKAFRLPLLCFSLFRPQKNKGRLISQAPLLFFVTN